MYDPLPLSNVSLRTSKADESDLAKQSLGDVRCMSGFRCPK